MDPLLRDDQLVVPRRSVSSPDSTSPKCSRRSGFPWAAVSLVLLLIASGCGGDTTDEDRSGSNGERESRSIESAEPFEITAAAALLERARQPGTGERAVLCQQILDDFPDSPEAQEALFLLCKLDQNANRHEAAYEGFRRLVSEYPAGKFASEAHQYIWSYESKVAQDEGAHARATSDAIADLTARLDRHPDEWLDASGRTLAMAYLERGDTEGAIGALEKQIDAAPSERSLAEQTRITAYFHLGSLYVREGNHAQARSTFERGLKALEASEVIDSVSRDASRTSFETAIAQLDATEQGG